MIRALSRFFRHHLWREDGTATIEFVIVVPVVMSVFVAAVEAGFFMTKRALLERGLDLVIREVRLGNVTDITGANRLRELVCAATPIMADCEDTLRVEMRLISTLNFNIPSDPPECIDRSSDTKLDDAITPGGSHEIMLVRVCAVQDPMFPSTGLGLQMQRNAGGGYQMAAASVFVNEPQ
jgi:hypothetical protein